jgi:hypothetical protein
MSKKVNYLTVLDIGATALFIVFVLPIPGRAAMKFFKNTAEAVNAVVSYDISDFPDGVIAV